MLPGILLWAQGRTGHPTLIDCSARLGHLALPGWLAIARPARHITCPCLPSHPFGVLAVRFPGHLSPPGQSAPSRRLSALLTYRPPTHWWRFPSPLCSLLGCLTPVLSLGAFQAAQHPVRPNWSAPYWLHGGFSVIPCFPVVWRQEGRKPGRRFACPSVIASLNLLRGKCRSSSFIVLKRISNQTTGSPYLNNG